MRFNHFFFSISVVDIKEELVEATPHVKIELEMEPLLITEKGFQGVNYDMDGIDIKEEPLQEEVSEFYKKYILFTQLAMLYSTRLIKCQLV